MARAEVWPQFVVWVRHRDAIAGCGVGSDEHEKDAIAHVRAFRLLVSRLGTSSVIRFGSGANVFGPQPTLEEGTAIGVKCRVERLDTGTRVMPGKPLAASAAGPPRISLMFSVKNPASTAGKPL